MLKTQISIDFDGAVPAGSAGSALKTVQKKQADGKNDESYFEILFALRETPSGYYIRDAKVEGQSVLMFLRSQMEEELRSAGYDPEVFLEAMRKKLISVTAPPKIWPKPPLPKNNPRGRPPPGRRNDGAFEKY